MELYFHSPIRLHGVTWTLSRSLSRSDMRLFRKLAGKFAGSFSDEVIGFFNLPHPSSRSGVLGSTQPLTEMNTRYLPGGKGWLQISYSCHA
jgi:hypothetical protein